MTQAKHKAPGLTYPQMRSLNPCPDNSRVVVKKLGGVKKWDGNLVTVEDARSAGVDFEDIVWVISVLSRDDKDVERRLRLWLSDCAARVLKIFEKEFPADARPRKSIIATRRYARTNSEAAKAAEAARAAGAAEAAKAAEAARAAWAAEAAGAARAAEAAGAAWAAWAAWAAEAARAAGAAGAARAAEAAWAAWAAWAAEAAEREWQFGRLVLWFSENEPKSYPLPKKPKEQSQ